MYKKKSLSPLIATILLIVVSVILITVVLTWGSSFTKDNLNKATNTVDFKESDLSSFLTITNILQLSENNVVTIRNLHSKEPITFIGYKLITKENYVFANQKLYFDEVITLEPGAITSLNLICFPENSFTLQLFDQDQTHFTLPIKINNYRSDSYCMGKDNIVVAYDMETIVDDTLIDISGNKNDGLFFGSITRESNGIVFDGYSGYLETESNNLLEITNNISVFCFIKPIESIDVYDTFAGRFDSGTSNRVWWILRENSGKRLEVRIYPSGGSTPLKQYRSIITINDDEKYTVGFTFGDNQLKLYINGVEISTSKVSDVEVNELFSSNEPLRLSASQNNLVYQNFFNGAIFDFRFYNRILSDQEIEDYHSIMTNPLE